MVQRRRTAEDEINIEDNFQGGRPHQRTLLNCRFSLCNDMCLQDMARQFPIFGKKGLRASL